MSTSPSCDSTPYLLPMPGGPIRIWPLAVLRGAGFAVADLVALGDPAYAGAVDDLSDAEVAGPAGQALAAEGEGRQQRLLAAVAARADLQEAVAWQNPKVLRDAVLPFAAGAAWPRNQRTRRKERIVARYWARYLAKNDTIGFFGPVCWVRMSPEGPPVAIRSGERLAATTTVYLEPWAVDAIAASLAADPLIRPWVPPRPNPSTLLRGDEVVITDGLPQPLTDAEALLLARCDGERTARDLAAGLLADHPGRYADEAEVFGLLDGLVAARLARWDLEPPLTLRPIADLRRSLDVIGDAPVRGKALAVLDRIEGLLDGVRAAAGDVTRLPAALAALDDEFVRVTAGPAQRREGETYGGRQLTYQDTTRDVDATFGPQIVERIGEPLSLLAYSARSFTAELADRYEELFLGGWAIMRGMAGDGPIRLAHLMGVCARELFDPGQRIFEPVIEGFAHRWEKLLAIDATEGPVRLRSADLWPELRATFRPVDEPGWVQAYQHSVDIQLLPDGDGFAPVLGEFHIAWNTLEAGVFVDQHPRPGEIADLLAASLPRPRVTLVPVKHYPRVLARTMPGLALPDEWSLALADYPGGHEGRHTSLVDLLVERGPDGKLWCRTEDGRARFRVVDVCGMLIAAEIMDAFKHVGRGRAHVPRVVVDDLVMLRESWSAPLDELDLKGAKTEIQTFHRVRAFARARRLPRFVFVHVPGELKPFYLDLTSSVQAASLATMVRHAQETAGPAAQIRLVEMLPTPADSWLPLPDGRTATSELRLQLADPGGAW